MTSTIKIKNSSTAGAVPGSGDLVQGELAVNVTDKKIYTKNASGTIVNLGTTPSITDNGNAEAIVIDSSENVGLGVSPSSWSAGWKAFELPGGASFANNAGDRASITWNAVVNGGAWTYKANGAANRYEQTGGSHYWYYAGSGTAGNAISFTQAMTLDASGNLGVGTTSPTQKLDVVGSGAAIAMRVATTSGNAAFVETSASTGSVVARLQSNVDGAWSGTLTNHAYFFQTNGSERARIDSSGRLLVNVTSSLSGVVSIHNNASDYGLTVGDYYNTSKLVRFLNSSDAQVGSITQTGSSTAYNTSSDYRLKENVQPMTGALARVAELKPVTYTWKSTGEAGEGFIAHELQEIVPDCVTGEKDAVDDEGNPEYQGIDTSFLVATLTAAIQEQQAIIAQQSLAITQLQADVAALKG